MRKEEDGGEREREGRGKGRRHAFQAPHKKKQSHRLDVGVTSALTISHHAHGAPDPGYTAREYERRKIMAVQVHPIVLRWSWRYVLVYLILLNGRQGVHALALMSNSIGSILCLCYAGYSAFPLSLLFADSYPVPSTRMRLVLELPVLQQPQTEERGRRHLIWTWGLLPALPTPGYRREPATRDPLRGPMSAGRCWVYTHTR